MNRLVALLAVALVSCGPIDEAGRSEAENERLRERNTELVSACLEAGGEPLADDQGAGLYVGCVLDSQAR